MSFLLTLHGEIRWLVALVAIIAIVRFALGWMRGMEYQRMDRGLMSGFTGLMDLNLLLGIILLLFTGGFVSSARTEHVVTMFIAVVVAHASAAWRKSDNSAVKFRNNLIAVIVALVLVLVGVLRLRGGWVF